MTIDLSIIIVSWKVKDKLLANLEALKSSVGDFKAEVFIVDNDSADGTISAVQDFITENNKDNRFVWKLIVNDSNLGFAKANNIALSEASGSFILLLNPDMAVFSNTLSDMLTWCRQNPSAAVSGCRLEDAEGSLLPHVRNFPKLSDQLAIVLKLPHIFPDITKGYLRPDFDYSKASVVDSVRGAFFMINIDAFKKLSGGTKPFLDNRYFIWFEEVDFCRQVKKLGGEVWYTPAAHCLDHVGASFSKVPRGQAQRYFRDSMLAYFKKWEPAWQSLLLASAWGLGIALAAIADKLAIRRKFRA
jgi:GT2 family glycosyltransferase